MVSVIIPFYNEEERLLRNSVFFHDLCRRAELIFVDGESSDRGRIIAAPYGKVIEGKKGRALQMNLGASFAKGDIFLFLHADAHILPDALASVEKAIQSQGCIGGCLTQRIDNSAFIYRFIEWQGNNRAVRTKVFYGDQGIFTRKEIFLAIGGFPEVPIMEDILFTRKLQRLGKTVVLPEQITVSARRWEKRGVIRTALLYNLILFLFWLKVPLSKIKKLYDDLR